MTEPDEVLVSTRLSRFYYTDYIDDPGLQEKLASDRVHGFYLRMFEEDLSHMLPWGRGLDDGFTARVVSDDPRASDLIREALPSRYRPARDLSDGLRDFVEYTGEAIVTSPVHFEIDYLHEPADPAKAPVAFRLEELVPGTVDVIDGRPVQYVPSGMSPLRSKQGLHYVALDERQLVTIRLPEYLEDALSAALLVYAAADRQQGVPVAMLERGAEQAGFESVVHQEEMGLRVLKGTREIGWTGRGLFSDGLILDAHAVWRHLNFVRFQIKVRNVILAALDEAIKRAAARLGFSAQLDISGLKQLSDIDVAEQALMNGSRPLNDLIALGP